MRESCTSGSVRGARGNSRPYRNRREFVTLLGGAAAAWPLAGHAQQAARYRIGHLAIAAPTDTPPPPPANWDAFVQGLHEAGYIEGRNIAFEHRSAHDQPEALP